MSLETRMSAIVQIRADVKSIRQFAVGLSDAESTLCRAIDVFAAELQEQLREKIAYERAAAR